MGSLRSERYNKLIRNKQGGVHMAASFRKRLIDNVPYEAAAVFDVDNDGVLDIVCGAYWYKGPDFSRKTKICDIRSEGEYYDDFSDYGLDVNGDGLPDIITGGWWGETLRWRENPGNNDLWKIHDIDHCGSIETIRFYDIDGCGTPEVFPNTPNAPAAFYKLDMDNDGKPLGRFTKHVMHEGPMGHGMGFADVDGDGRIDLLLARGWLRQPEEGPLSGPWTFQDEYELPFWAASVPILGHDVNGNGLTDLIVGNAHGYGLLWLEQVLDQGNRRFIPHVIDETAAQYHDLQLCDIDNDGELELITGKRWRAHCGNDPGDNDPVGIYVFKLCDGHFKKTIIEYGEASQGHSGVGIWFCLADFGSGRTDIVAPGKEGLYLFENIGNA